MERFIRYFLAGLMVLSFFLAGLFMIVPTYMDQLTALGFTPEEMRIWVYRVVVPTYFLTIAYFSYRYLSGKNPTSTVWPILIVTFFFLVSQIIGFVFFFFHWIQIFYLLITVVSFFVLREAHNRRKNDIFGSSL
tara:strand:+ start:197 stop:598 length:402 start_codon:yes stop_codon:yes gene_type:complete